MGNRILSILQNLSTKRVILFISVITFLVYLNALWNGFVWDDKFLILENDSIRSFSNIPHIFSSEFRLLTSDTGFYRPIVTLSMLIDYKLWGIEPFGFHLTNILLHILATILIYFFILNLFHDRGISFLASLVFALHPIHSANVTWISGRGDILCALFYILSLILFIKSNSAGKVLKMFLFPGSLAFFFLALLSKEMAISLPLVILLYIFCRKGREKEKPGWVPFLKQGLPYFLVAGIYIILRVFIIGQVVRQTFRMEELPFRMLTTADIIIQYIRLLILPSRLNFYYITFLIKSVMDPRVLFAFFVLISVGWITVTLYNRSRTAFFAILWFFITLLPVSNIIAPWSTLMAEHWLYIPSIGFCILVAVIFMQRPGAQRVMPVVVGGFLVASSLSIISINRTWKDEFTFYTRMTTVTPQFYLGHYNLGNVYYRMGEYNLAVYEYKRAIDLNPDYVHSYVNLAGIYNERRLFDEAIALFRKALSMNPEDEEIRANIIIARENREKLKGQQTKRIQDIETGLKEAIDKNPADPNIYNNLGVFYAQAGRIDEALEQFKKAVELEPEDLNIYLNLGNAYAKKGLPDKAIQVFNTALEKDPKEFRVYYALSVLYQQQGHNELAAQALENYILYCPEGTDKDEIKANIRMLREKQ